MLRIPVLAAALALFPALAMAQMPDSLKGEWLAEDIGGGGVLDRVQTTIAFGEAGAVSGSGGCNRMAGKAEIDGEHLTFGPIAATKMACAPAQMDQETKFFAALDKVSSFRIDEAQTKLFLLDDGGAELVRLSRMKRGAVLEIEVPGADEVERISTVYDCGTRKIQAEYINAGPVSLAALSINGEFVVAANVIAASGARYAGGRYVWWTKGNTATLEDQTDTAQPPLSCTEAG